MQNPIFNPLYPESRRIEGGQYIRHSAITAPSIAPYVRLNRSIIGGEGRPFPYEIRFFLKLFASESKIKIENDCS